MKIKNRLSVAAAGLMGAASIASAAPIFYTLNTAPNSVDGNFGTVEMDDVGNSVNFTVTLAAGEVFANTGNTPRNAFAFNLGSGFAIALTGTTSSEVYVPYNGASFSQTPFGKFNAGINFTDAAKKGTSGKYSAPLTFKVTKDSGGDVSYADFQSLSTGKKGGYMFSADIGIGKDNKDTFNVATGDQVTTPNGDPSPIPEPATIALLGLGLLGATLVRRRKI